MARPALAVVHCPRNGQPRHVTTEPGDTVTVVVAADRDGMPARAGHGVLLEIDVEVVLGEPAPTRGRRLDLGVGLDTAPFK
jgi:hypothetical protein